MRHLAPIYLGKQKGFPGMPAALHAGRVETLP